MGCASSAATGNDAPRASGQDKSNQELRLLDEYAVGQTLGEGAFGVVSVCKKRATGQEFAVKMVDKVETPVEAIKKEADMLASMDHPNIVKFHGVYYERCFVCIVMDKLDGGDLVEGLQRHLKERGQINCLDVVHVAYQMASSISYLHNRNVVHRDVKGDNYLMDRKNMTDGQCKIVLTDFGTACNCKPADRLSSGVGTKIFWPPEFFDREYGQKVDVWAMGVIMYGLVSGRFPFRDENDVRNKEVRIPKRVHPVCEEYIRKMLDKSEKTRMSSSEGGHAFAAADAKCLPFINEWLRKPAREESANGHSSLWRVIGGADKGGIIVRTGPGLTDEQAKERLSTGSLVEELEKSGDRIRYRLQQGNGPREGWVTLRLAGGKELLVKA